MILRLAFAVLTLFTATSAQAQADRALESRGRFVDTTVGFWNMEDDPVFARQATLAALMRASPDGTTDFGLSFNCAVRTSGALTDCRLIHASPESVNGAALVRAAAPLFRLSRASAELAHRMAYRLTIDMALDTLDRHGMRKGCTPPFCIVEMAVPPPPPQPIGDPAMAAVLDDAETCYHEAWERSGTLRFAAEKALRDRKTGPADAAERKLALDYVKSRHALAACIASLRQAAHVLPIDGRDAKAVERRIAGMQSGYEGQTPFELAILVGLLDPAAAAVEQTIR